MNRAHFNVSGLANEQMKTALKNALDKVEGVQMVNIDMGRGTVEVGFDEPESESLIMRCIEKTGFKIS